MGLVQAAEFKVRRKKTSRVASMYFGTSLLLMEKLFKSAISTSSPEEVMELPELLRK